MGTKIMVIKLKELIRTFIFILAGLVMIVMLIYFFFPKKDAEAAKAKAMYEPGEYTASIILQGVPLEIAVSVNDHKITDISLFNFAEIQEVFYPLIEPTLKLVADEVIKKQSLDITLPIESEITGKVLLGAVQSALTQATLDNSK